MSLVVGILFAIYALTYDRRIIIVGVLGLLLSLVYWVPVYLFYWTSESFDGLSGDFQKGTFRLGISERQSVPTLTKIVFPNLAGDMYMQEGFGPVFFVLLLSSLVFFSFRRPWFVCATLWFVFAFLGLISQALPISLHPGRFWGIVPLGGALMVAHLLSKIPKKLTWVLLGLIVVTSGIPKAHAQLSYWPSDIGDFLDWKINSYVQLLLFATVWLAFLGFLDDYRKVAKSDTKGVSPAFKLCWTPTSPSRTSSPAGCSACQASSLRS